MVVFWAWSRLHATSFPRLSFAVPAVTAIYFVACYYHANLFDFHRALAGVLTRQYTLEKVWERPAFHKSGYSVAADLQVASYLRANSQPSDEVFVWGFDPTVYFVSHRTCASRFIYNMTLYGDWSWPEQRQEMTDDLTHNRPLFILILKNDAMPWVTGSKDDSATAFEKFSGFKQMVAANYVLTTEIQNFAIYRRDDAARTALNQSSQ
jgi:hypothetical protein